MQRSSSSAKSAKEPTPSSTDKTTAAASFHDLIIAYHKNTGMACKALDGYLTFCAFTGIMQAIYCLTVSSFPYNAFIGTFAASVGSFVFAANVRLKWSNLKELSHQEIVKTITEFMILFYSFHKFTLLAPFHPSNETAPIIMTFNFNPSDPPSLAILVGRESEHNWEQRDRLIDAITRYCQETQPGLQYASVSSFGSLADLRVSSVGSLSDPRYLLSNLLKINYEDIMAILHTPRTQLSIRVCTFIQAFAHFLGPSLFDQYAETSLHHLLKLSGTTKKIIAASATNAAKSIASLMLSQRTINVLLAAGQEKNVSVRKSVMECLKVLCDRSVSTSDEGSLQRLWDGLGEKLFSRALGDANAEIRALSASIFIQFRSALPSTQQFAEKLDPSTKKQLSLLLAKQNPPKPATPPTSKFSLKAVINKVQQRGSDEDLIISSNTSYNVSSSTVPSNQSTPKSPTKSPSKSPTKSISRPPFTTSPLKSHSSDNLRSNYLLTKSPSQLFMSSSADDLRKAFEEESKDLQSMESRIDSKQSNPISAPPTIPNSIPISSNTPHRKSPLKHAKSADSLLSSGTASPSKSPQKRPTVLQLDNDPDVPMDSISCGSPMKVDDESKSVMNASVYLDAISSDSDTDGEVILNVKNAIKLFESRSVSKLDTPKFRETIAASSLTSSLHASSRDSFMMDSMKEFNSPLPCAELDELTIELPKKIQFDAHHRSASLAETSENSLLNTPIAQRVQTLGLASSTPLRRLYRTSSDASTCPVSSTNSESLLTDLMAEFCISRDDTCLQKIVALAHKSTPSQPLPLDPHLLGSLFASLSRNSSAEGTHLALELAQCVLQRDPSLLAKSFPFLLELLETASRGDLVARQLAQSSLNATVALAAVSLCCQRLSEFRLSVLGGAVHCCVDAPFMTTQLLPAMIPPLLLALNHPSAQIRRLAVSCFQQVSERVGKEVVLEAVQGGGIGDVPRRLLQSFLQ